MGKAYIKAPLKGSDDRHMSDNWCSGLLEADEGSAVRMKPVFSLVGVSSILRITDATSGIQYVHRKMLATQSRGYSYVGIRQ